MTNITDKQTQLNKLILSEYVLLKPDLLKDVLAMGANPNIYSKRISATPLTFLLRDLYRGDDSETEDYSYMNNVDLILESCKILVEAGAKLEDLNNDKTYYRTAVVNILYSSMHVNPLIKYLEKQGVDFLFYQGEESILENVISPAVLKFLLDKGADANGKNNQVMEVLGTKTNQPRPPLTYLGNNCRERNDAIKMLQTLLDAGAIIDLPNDHNAYALSSYIYDDPKVLNFLLDNGADPRLEDSEGMNAFDHLLYRLDSIQKDDEHYEGLMTVKSRMLEIMDLDLKL